MKLKEIDKTTYRKHLNIIIAGFIASLLVLALAYGQGLIMLFADNNAIVSDATLTSGSGEPATPSSNFKFNLLGVILALLTCMFALHKLRSSDFFAEVYYVWQVKQLQNLIYRKLKKIKAAASNDDVNALIILSFYYASLKQIYLLDDNTLTMSKLNKDTSELASQIADKNVTVTLDQFDKSLLANY
ncbi:Protein of unknown function [Colwellia chukchiensis]|uniref:DUF3087 domain-containing protein n=1 Tax=Colwellia chukchiensis TaxID=641665 RepID=A0A1H7KP68_9GAMM|nr:DUF3087 domain-containing protein [Colwellia chukchiensis]SEK87727.1 Protein of unknown function [Colwellia chukchiensis]